MIHKLKLLKGWKGVCCAELSRSKGSVSGKHCVRGNERRLVWPKLHESGWGGGALARNEAEEKRRPGLLEDSK